jgi:hypothetical protein
MTRTSPLVNVLKHTLPFAAVGALGCTSGENGQLMSGNGPLVTVSQGPTVDAGGIFDSVKNGAYLTGPQFKQVSKVYASAKDPVYIAEWVSANAFDLYSRISPEDGGVPIDDNLPVGTIIIRAMYGSVDAGTPDNPGPLDKLTLMSKGPPGYDPDLGDWWFSVTDPNANPIDYPDGAPQDGQMSECHSCHQLERGLDNDFLFGAPTNERATP